MTLDDMLATIQAAGGKQAGLGTLAKQIERLQRKSAPVQPLLPRVVRERQQRKAGCVRAECITCPLTVHCQG